MPAAGGLSDALGRLASEEDRKPEPEHEPEVEIRSAKSMRADETTVLSVEQIEAEADSKSKSQAKPRRAGRAESGSGGSSSASRLADAGRGATRSTSSRRPSSSSGRGGNRRAASQNHDLKRTAIPILLTVGVVLLIPGIWAVCLLIGLEVPRHNEPDAKQVALAMLITWPLSLCMIGGAIFFLMQTRGGKPNAGKRAARG